jgi:hypothetical protein
MIQAVEQRQYTVLVLYSVLLQVEQQVLAVLPHLEQAELLLPLIQLPPYLVQPLLEVQIQAGQRLL